MMSLTKIRNNILSNIKTYLKLETGRYEVFSEELQGKHYSVVLLTEDKKKCVLANCKNVFNPNSMVEVVSF